MTNYTEGSFSIYSPDFNEEYESQLINEEFKIWKKNTPYLYDLIVSKELDWPSLTCQWLPTKGQSLEADYDIHKLLLGTNTSGGEPNYLMIAKVRLPSETTLQEFSENPEKDIATTSFADKKIDIEIKMVHEGEVNRAVYMPQKYNIIASFTVSGEVHIFDYTQHSHTKNDSTVASPQLRLSSHTMEGYGLSWNVANEGKLLSSSYDTSVCLWDIQGSSINGFLKPVTTFAGHEGYVEDVSWSKKVVNLFGSVGDDKSIILWDTREGNNKPTHVIPGHCKEINSIDFSPFNEFLFLTGSADKSVKLWDLRHVSKSLHSFEGHTDQVLRVEWSPFSQAHLASCSIDRRVIVWDITKIGSEINASDSQDGPAELLFIHGGHRARIPDFSWNQNDNFLFASVEEENNVVQVWQISRNIYEDDLPENRMDIESK